MSEKLLKEAVFRMFKKHYPDIFAVKLSDQWVSGIPDILILSGGRALWIELKTKSGVVSTIQRFMFGKIKRRGGCPVKICRSVADAKEVIRLWL